MEFRVYAMAGVRVAAAVLAVLSLLLGAQAKRMWDHEVAERPFFRHPDGVVTTSSLIDSIGLDERQHYMMAPEPQQKVRSEEGLAEFLFKVNNIEREGFETYEETREAIAKGALALGDEIQSDKRLEALRSLYKAFRCMFPADDGENGNNFPQLSVSKIVEAHRELMKSTKPEIAGRIRRQPSEVVFTMTVNGTLMVVEDPFHVFRWPTEVPQAALEDLIERANADLLELQNEQNEAVKLRNLLKLGARLFFEFEAIHPFVDGNGRIGRILLATVLRSMMPIPTVLYNHKEQPQLIPFVKQKYQMMLTEQGYRFIVSQEDVAAFKRYPPEDLAALIADAFTRPVSISHA